MQQKQNMQNYEDMITDKKNNLERLSSKESEMIERTKIAESVYDMFRQGGTDDVRDKLIDVMYENQKLKEENTTLKKLLEKAYEFIKQFVIDGINLLERFQESVGKVVRKIRCSYLSTEIAKQTIKCENSQIIQKCIDLQTRICYYT